MDFNKALGFQHRVVQDAQYAGQPARIVSGRRTFDTTPEDLWNAITDAERLPRWFLPITGDLKLGGHYQLEGNAGGEIKRCDPPEALDLTWECGGTLSWVTVRLESQESGTQLTLEHIMQKDEASETHWKQYGPGATGVGWDLGLIGMDLHVSNDGVMVDRDEANAWMASDAGKAFIRESAKAWGQAHIESGEQSDVALTMAEQTSKAYTGE